MVCYAANCECKTYLESRTIGQCAICDHPNKAHRSKPATSAIVIEDLTVSPKKTTTLTTRAFIQDAQRHRQSAFPSSSTITPSAKNLQSIKRIGRNNRSTNSVADTLHSSEAILSETIGNSISTSTSITYDVVLYTKKNHEHMRKESPVGIWRLNNPNEEVENWQQYILDQCISFHPAWIALQHFEQLEFDCAPPLYLMGGEVLNDKGDPSVMVVKGTGSIQRLIEYMSISTIKRGGSSRVKFAFVVPVKYGNAHISSSDVSNNIYNSLIFNNILIFYIYR